VVITADDELIRRALEGDQKAYAALVERYRGALYHIVLKMVRRPEEAEDLVQEAFIKAFGALASYRFEYRFSTWLYKIAANSAIDYLRKRRIDALSLDRPVATPDGEIQVELADWTYNPEETLHKHRQRVSIAAAIESLPEKYREVILMRHSQDMPYHEIARSLGVPVGTVKARIFRARELLKKQLRGIR
jgi:RNA polymerase sigma-70 factor (ECF subfamily)